MMPTETNRDMRAKPETIGRMPRTPDGLSDDAWREGVQVQRAMSTAMPPMPVCKQHADDPCIFCGAEREPDMPDRDWFSWRDWEWRDLWAVAFVGVVLAFAAHVVGWWPA